MEGDPINKTKEIINQQQSNHHSNTDMNKDPSKKKSETVGSLLADIADYLVKSLGALRFADKRHWGPDEFEQIRALEDALDDAKTDFQELGVLVNGQFYYEGDRTRKYFS